MDILRFLPKNEYDAAVSASAPTAANPFATVSDLGAYVPIAGNTGNPMTGDLVMGSARKISSSNGAFIEFDAAANRITLQNRDDAFNKANMYILGNNTLVFQAGNFGFVDGFADNKITPKSIDFNLYSNPFSKWGRFGMINNSSAAVSPFDFASFPAYAAIRNVTINQNTESIFCAGRGYIAKSNDGMYSNRYYLSKNNEAFELAIEHQTVTGSDKVATFQNASGIVAYLSDITGGNTIYTADDTVTGNRLVDLDGNILAFLTAGGGFLGVGSGTQIGTESFRVSGSSLFGNASANTVINGNGLFVNSGGSTNTTNFSVTNDADGQYFTITSSGGDGRVAIGTTTSTARLHVRGSSLTNSLDLQNSLGITWFVATDSQSIGIGTTAPQASRILHAVGQSRFDGNIFIPNDNLYLGGNILSATGIARLRVDGVSGGEIVSFRTDAGAVGMSISDNREFIVNGDDDGSRIALGVSAGNEKIRVRMSAANVYGIRHETFGGAITFATLADGTVAIGQGATSSRLTVNGDVETVTNTEGFIVLDRTNGTRYRIYTDGGVLNTEAA